MGRNGASLVSADSYLGFAALVMLSWAAWALFVSAFTSATLLPGSSELALGALLLKAPDQWPWWVLVATLGNALGSMVSWSMGYWLARYRPLTPLVKPAQQRALAWLQRHGYYSLLLAWVPVVGDPLCLLAGWLRWSWSLSLFFILMGKAARYLLIVMTADLLW